MTTKDEMHEAYQDGLDLVGQGDADTRSLTEQLDWHLGVLEGLPQGAKECDRLKLEIDLAEPASERPSPSRMWQLLREWQELQYASDMCDEAETAINDALPPNVRKFFAYGTDNGMIGLIVLEEYEAMMESIV